MIVLVSDFDETFYTEDYLINIKLINDFVAAGNVFIIATGRNINHLVQGIDGHEINYSYLICNDGGIIFNRQFHILKRTDINPKYVEDIFNLTSLVCDRVEVDTSANLVNYPTTPANAILGRFNDEKRASDILDQIMSKYPLVHGYLSENWINITNHLVNKANGIKFICEQEGYDNVYVTGDGINDLSMFENYPGIALSNSNILLKTKAITTVRDFKEVITYLTNI